MKARTMFIFAVVVLLCLLAWTWFGLATAVVTQ